MGESSRAEEEDMIEEGKGVGRRQIKGDCLGRCLGVTLGG